MVESLLVVCKLPGTSLALALRHEPTLFDAMRIYMLPLDLLPGGGSAFVKHTCLLFIGHPAGSDPRP